MKWLASAIVVLSIVSSTPRFAWGAEGHQIIAHIAARELTPGGRAEVERLLGGDAEATMVEASTWADETRPQRPNTAPWHFVDIPIGSRGYDAQRDCERDDCILAQIAREERVVADRALLTPVRAEALRFLIHFVGDLHQPLHASDNGDRGGNQVRVVLRGRRTNLHAVWDVDVVRALGQIPVAVVADLEADISAATHQIWESGTAESWANESFRLASHEIYSTSNPLGASAPLILPRDYPERQRTLVRTQLEKAGVRLAWVLNRVLR